MPAPYQPPQWPRKVSTGWIIVGSVSIVLIACCIGALILANAGNNSAVANSTPQATATSLPSNTAAIFAPTLGGTMADFTPAYGQPDSNYNDGGLWLQITIAGWPVALQVAAPSPSQTLDSQPHMFSIIVSRTDGGFWDTAMQQRVMAPFLPRDAKFEYQQATDKGEEWVYRSASLAATFTPDPFNNHALTQTLPPGTLYEQCDSGHAVICQMLTGVYS